MHAQEWSKNQVAVDSEAKSVTHDSNGNVLEDGDDVVVIKECLTSAPMEQTSQIA